MQVDAKLLVAVYGDTSADEGAWAVAINSACQAYQINTGLRIAAFVAQVGVESGRLRYTEEIWGPTPQQKRYERDFTQGWEATNPRNSLAFRLGNLRVGDGKLFKGHGLLQVTGRFNHAAFRDRMRSKFGSSVPDFEQQPQLIADKKWAALSAVDYWDSHHLNPLADAKDIVGLTRKINGGLNGVEERKSLYAKALKVLGL